MACPGLVKAKPKSNLGKRTRERQAAVISCSVETSQQWLSTLGGSSGQPAQLVSLQGAPSPQQLAGPCWPKLSYLGTCDQSIWWLSLCEGGGLV